MGSAPRTVAGLVGAALIASAVQSTPLSAPAIALQGTVLQATLADGTALAGRQLAGRHLLIPDGGDGLVALRIDTVQEDSVVPGLHLYEMLLQAPAGEWSNICEPDKDGGRWAIPLGGSMTDDGRFEPDSQKLTLTCTSGVVGKCLRAGYRFWTNGGSIDPRALQRFQACTRLFRADYCGDGQGWTADGTLIDVYDDEGVQSPEPASTLQFEAGWSPAGAVCVHHTRVPENIRLDELLRRCPRLAAASGQACTEDHARRAGAILFNKSGMRR